jgi:acrylyl-CoA reductase (NADPH)
MFTALYSTKENKVVQTELKQLDESALPAGDVDVRVEFSTINFKDALAITGRSPIARVWPMVPGIDLGGVVESSRDPAWKVGDRVVVTGWGLGEQHWGGLTQKARLSSGWLLALPKGLSTRDSMVIATAGFTAALCVMALQKHGTKPGDGEVLVTGAAGGVGSIAVALLAGLGYDVVASTGRPQESEYLKFLGAAKIADRNELSSAGKPLQSERWVGVVDTVGSHTLANVCAQTKANGAVTACGLAQGADFPATVMPFILRSVTLYGVCSVLVPNDIRAKAWQLIAQHVDRAKLEQMTTEIGLSQAIAYAPLVLDGKVRGRTVVDVNR